MEDEMRKGLALASVVLLALAFVATGCGSDNNSDNSSGGSAQTKTSEPSKSGGAKVDTNDPQVQQAIKRCEAQVNANPQLSSEAKSKVSDVCKKAASGDAKAAIQATKEACRVIVEDTAPAGAAKQAALDACDKASG
jgi:hypothetical protein